MDRQKLLEADGSEVLNDRFAFLCRVGPVPQNPYIQASHPNRPNQLKGKPRILCRQLRGVRIIVVGAIVGLRVLELTRRVILGRVATAAVTLLFVVSFCSSVHGQGWFRKQVQSTSVQKPRPNSSWQYDVTPSAFQSSAKTSTLPPNVVELPDWRSQDRTSRPLPEKSESELSRAQLVESGHSNSVSAPLPRRRSSGKPVRSDHSNERSSSVSASRSGHRGSAIVTPAMRLAALTQYESSGQPMINTLPGRSLLSSPGSVAFPLPVSEAADIPPTILFWWELDLSGPILRGRPQMAMSLQEALHRAMNEAPELKILHADWYIESQEVIRRDAAFDWTTFVDTVWNRDSNPVGSQLDGAADRLRTRTESAAGGLRKRDRFGGQFEVSQQIAGKESNSRFINPNNQGSSRLALKYQRPLLRGAGFDYNTGSLRLAELNKDIAFDRMQAGIQDHLLNTAQAYWALVFARGDLLQKITSWSRAKAVADQMATRVNVNVDVTSGTLDRVKSEVSSRLAQSIQAEHDVVAAQEVLLELIYASRFTEFSHNEILTTTAPPHQPTGVDVESQADLAVQTRAEVQQAIREIRAASLEYDLAKNDVLPQLNLVLTGYSSGLQSNYNIGQSLLDQFSTGEPGTGVGLDFEIPYRNRAAKAAADQRRMAVMRLQREFEMVVGEVKQDVRQQAIRRNKFAETLPQQWESLIIARRLMEYSQTQGDFLADGVRLGDLYLNDLLQIQSRLQNAEFQYLQTQVSFAVAESSLMRSLSTLQTVADPGRMARMDSDASDATSTAP